MMNSYFEQSGFYGTPSSGGDQSYRFPIGLGMSPYAQHHTGAHRAPQDSPYDATAAACKLYSSQVGGESGPGYNKVDCGPPTGGVSKESNGYNGKGGGGELGHGGGGSVGGANSWGGPGGVPVRPTVCSPDGRYGGGGVVGGGGGGGEPSSPSRSLSSWNATCNNLQNGVGVGGVGGVPSQATASQLQQSANHTFYP